MKGIEGNFMSQPRVFAHSAMPVSGSLVQIVGTEERGCALYVGTGGTLVVKMEGTHQTALMPGPSYVAIFTNVPSGSFLPILVTHVLESNNDDLLEQLALAEAAVSAGEARATAAADSLEAAEKELEAAEKELEQCIGGGGTDEACGLTYGPAVDEAKRAVDEANLEVKNAEDALKLAEERRDIAAEKADQPATTTSASDILALF